VSFDVNTPEGCGPAPRVSFFTLGCRLNHHDTAAMRGDLARAGWTPVDEGTPGSGADVLVVNTCTVTRRADQESRQLIRRLARERPGARIVVTGCYAQRAPEEVRAIAGVSAVLGTAERESIAARLAVIVPETAGVAAARAAADLPTVAVAPGRSRPLPFVAPAPLHVGRARALVKVQDGCDAFCGYCIVPYVRGRSRSVPRAEVMAQASRLLEAGFRELVLTGADLGDYRGCRGEPSDLADLIGVLLALDGRHRVRLSSIEPNKVDPSLVDLLSREPRLCRHLHLPLQSGSATVLRAMRRAYAPGDYARLIERVAAAGPVAIGADVIVGFPGESEREFEETAAFIESLPIAFLHVFRYSPRPGTRALSLEDAEAAAPVVRERAERLRLLGERQRRAFAQSLVGTHREVILESRNAADGSRLGTSDLYATVAVPDSSVPSAARDPINVRITSFDGTYLRGEPVAATAASERGASAER
jgi:threonylcarbamoyladenosine tRNA methylthiotransferase MtaB